MNLLILDTSSSFLQIKLVLTSGESLSFSYFKNKSLNNSYVADSLSFLLKQSDLSLKDINLIIAPSGPGSFTGLRVGMSFAKGISCALNIPIVFINLLDALSVNSSDYTLSAIDGKKGRLFASLYDRGERISPYWDLSLEEVMKEVKKIIGENLITLRVKGNAVPAFKELNSNILIANNFLDTISGLEILGLIQYKEKGADPVGSNLFYLRDSDAKATIRKS